MEELDLSEFLRETSPSGGSGEELSGSAPLSLEQNREPNISSAVSSAVSVSGREALVSPRLPLSAAQAHAQAYPHPLCFSSNSSPRDNAYSYSGSLSRGNGSSGGGGGLLEPLSLSLPLSVSLSSGNGNGSGGKPSLLKPRQGSTGGWLTPTDSSRNRRTTSASVSSPSASAGHRILSASLPEQRQEEQRQGQRVSRATVSSRAFHKVKTLDLSPSSPPASASAASARAQQSHALTARPKSKTRHTAAAVSSPSPSPLLPALKPLQGVKKLLIAKA
jgi:hypothetical protein